MKKIAFLLAIFLCASLMNAHEVNPENLKAAHIAAMKYNGHADLLAGREDKIVFMPCGKGIASACYGETIATAYMEKEDAKIYWYIEKQDNGVQITFKVTIKDVTSSRSFKAQTSDTEFRFIDLDFGKPADRFSINWSCLKSKVPGCISCLTNWVCWLGCAGVAIWQCVDLREGATKLSSRFGCPNCGYDFYYYAHLCTNCWNCFNGGSLTCPYCYSQWWTNGKSCSRCGQCYQ